MLILDMTNCDPNGVTEILEPRIRITKGQYVYDYDLMEEVLSPEQKEKIRQYAREKFPTPGVNHQLPLGFDKARIPDCAKIIREADKDCLQWWLIMISRLNGKKVSPITINIEILNAVTPDGGTYTIRDMAELCGCSRGLIFEIEKSALQKLRKKGVLKQLYSEMLESETENKRTAASIEKKL